MFDSFRDPRPAFPQSNEDEPFDFDEPELYQYNNNIADSYHDTRIDNRNNMFSN